MDSCEKCLFCCSNVVYFFSTKKQSYIIELAKGDETMSENDDLYITKTNLLSCEDVVSYLWKKCDKFSSPFKPEGAYQITDKVTYSDTMLGLELKKQYDISLDDARHMALKNKQEYDVDTVEFTTLDDAKRPLTNGHLVVIYRPLEKFYYIFLDQGKNKLKLLVKCIQKKKIFNAFPTETVIFF